MEIWKMIVPLSLVQGCIVELLDNWIEDVVMNLIVDDGVEEVSFVKVWFNV